MILQFEVASFVEIWYYMRTAATLFFMKGGDTRAGRDCFRLCCLCIGKCSCVLYLQVVGRRWQVKLSSPQPNVLVRR